MSSFSRPLPATRRANLYDSVFAPYQPGAVDPGHAVPGFDAACFCTSSRPATRTANYTESRDLIRQLQQLNAQWDSEVLKARIAITHNYDPLVTPLTDMTRL